VDAVHFVFGTYLCCLWSFARIFVRAASGRQRFNVLGAREETLDGLSATDAERLETLMTLNFQQFDDVSLMAG
jgi:hypothetical protein